MPVHDDTQLTPFAQFHARWWNISGQDTRRWAFYELGAFMCAQNTRKVHGPERRALDPWSVNERRGGPR